VGLRLSSILSNGHPVDRGDSVDGGSDESAIDGVQRFGVSVRRRWFLLAAIVILCSLSAVITQELLRSERFSRWAVGRVEPLLSQRLGTSVRIGAVRPSLIPVGVALREISIGPPNRPVAAASKVTLSLDLLPLLFHRLYFSQVVVDAPRLDLTRSREAWDRIAIGRSGEGGWSVGIGRMAIRQGAVSSEQPGHEGRLEGIDVSLALDSRKRGGTLFLRAGPGLWTQGGVTQQIEEVRFAGTLLRKGVQIDQLTLKQGRSELEIAGVIGHLFDGFREVTLALRLKSRFLAEDVGFPLQRIPGLLSVEALIDGTLPELQVTARGTVESQVQGKTPRLRPQEVRWSVRFRRGKELLGAFSGELLDVFFAGAIVATDPLQGNPVYQAGGRILSSPLSTLLGTFAPHPFSEVAALRAKGEFQIGGEGFGLEKVHGQGVLWVLREGLISRAEQSVSPVALLQRGEVRFEVLDRTLHLVLLDLSSSRSRVTAWGEISAKELSVQVTATCDALSEWSALSGSFPLEGALRAQGRLSGPIRDPEMTGRISIDRLTVRGVSLGGIRGGVQVAHRRLILVNAVLAKGASTYVLNGGVGLGGRNGDLTLDLTHGDPSGLLSAFYRPLPIDLPVGGRIRARGELGQFRVEGDLSLGPGTLYGQRVEKASIRFEATPEQIQFPGFLIRNGKSYVAGVGAVDRRLKVQAHVVAGIRDLKEITLLSQRPVRGAADLVASIDGDAGRPFPSGLIRLTGVSYGPTALGDGVLIVRSTRTRSVAALLFPQRGLIGVGTLGGESSHPWAVSFQSGDLEVAPLLEGWVAKEVSRIHLSLAMRVGLVGVGTDWHETTGEISVLSFLADLEGTALKNKGPLLLRLNRGELSVASFEVVGDGTELSVAGGVNLFKQIDLMVRGRFSIRFVGLLAPQLRGSKGEVALSIRVNDRWTSPKIRGEVSLQDGFLQIVAINQSLRVENASLFFDQERVLLQFEGRLGASGRIEVAGKMNLQGGRPGEVRLLVDAESLSLSPAPHLSVVASPHLVFQGEGGIQKISGEVLVRKAVYQEKLTAKTLLARLAAGPKELPSSTPFIGGAELQIHFFGRDGIVFDTSLAKLPLSIDLTARGTFDRPILLGRIETLGGELMVQSRKLTVTAGSVDFVNLQRTEPKFSLSADTEVKTVLETYKIEMTLSGTPTQIDMKLTSDPPLPETDVLSLLALGKTTAELSGSKEGIHTSEATALAIDTLLGGKIQQTIGVDRFEIGPYQGRSASGSETRVTVEKKVMGDRLSILFSSSLNTTDDELVQMEYTVNRHLLLILERDELGQTGGDIKLTFRFQ